MKRIFITGGSGFIGSTLIRELLKNDSSISVLNFDLLTYAGNNESLREIAQLPNYTFVHGDIADEKLLSEVIDKFCPDVVYHLAAESHVDRSIDDAGPFLHSNVIGTFTVLNVILRYWQRLSREQANLFRLLHISTDEVYGSLGEGGIFTEVTRYDPHNPYSATKAAADHLVRSWFYTYGLPVLITNCSNNYGPYQNPEKLIPKMIISAIAGKPLTIYGDGRNIRDWLFVEDHVDALVRVMSSGRIGETYNIGGENQHSVIETALMICDLLDRKKPITDGKNYSDLISFVSDRLGNDFRYAVDVTKLRSEFGWNQKYNFNSGLEKTVDWYLENEWWWKTIKIWQAPNVVKNSLR
ncbi:MAG: dTDP-glucose 4,6-dehydratase [Planctomycetaceae bacterium]|jgi:dTDP-glucose 4,6-dehydratase|nr:dTDP-glucose 4,6-dehydratase [Planctomycetaceae bacterium]